MTTPASSNTPTPPPRKNRKALRIIGLSSLALALLIVLVTVLGGHGSTSTHAASSPSASSSPSTSAPAPAPSKPAPSTAAPSHTVTYRVSGSPADVTYGPAGSSTSGTVPMAKTESIGDSDAAYYSITAQLQGSGTVTCSILMDGHAVSTAHASGGYNIASCEVVHNPITGKWEDANAGGA
jgi:hypothetical protein